MKPLLLLSGCLLLAACSSTLPPRVDLKGRRLLVIPFVQRPGREFDSTLGRDLADAVTAATGAALPKGARILDYRDAERLMPRSRSEDPDWVRLGQAMKADVLLLGEIKLYRLRDPKTTTTRRGTLVVGYRMLDVASRTDLLVVPSRSFRFPADQTNEEFAFGTDSFTKPEEIAAGLMAEAARGLAEEFQEHVTAP